MSNDIVGGDEVIQMRFKGQPHEDKLYREMTQPSEDLILKRNAELRKNPDALHDLGAQGKGDSDIGGTWGRQVASIPMIMYYQAIKDGYELDSTDKQHREKEMYRFLQSENGKLCLVQG